MRGGKVIDRLEYVSIFRKWMFVRIYAYASLPTSANWGKVLGGPSIHLHDLPPAQTKLCDRSHSAEHRTH